VVGVPTRSQQLVRRKSRQSFHALDGGGRSFQLRLIYCRAQPVLSLVRIGCRFSIVGGNSLNWWFESTLHFGGYKRKRQSWRLCISEWAAWAKWVIAALRVLTSLQGRLCPEVALCRESTTLRLRVGK